MQLDAFDKFDSCENMTNMQKICVLRESGGKGQLISKANFLVLIWTKKQTKLFFDYCPKDLK